MGQVTGLVNFFQMKVPADTFSQLEGLADVLMEEDSVLFAGYDYPVFLEASELKGSDSNPWGNDGNCAYDESSPSGNNWWAEAVGAYTAWFYSDRCSDYKVGVIDTGFYFGHEDLKGHIFGLEDQFCGIDEHGTLVAGIIGAANNEVGIRGIADGADLIVADWDRSRNYLESGEVLELHKEILEQGARVINDSWGYAVDSESTYRSEQNSTNPFKMVWNYLPSGNASIKEGYEEYLKSCKTAAKRTALDSMILILDLLNNGKKDFLFVKSAGNGYDNDGEVGLDTAMTGYFSSMSQEVYDKDLSGSAYTYEQLRDHVLIVSSVVNQRNSSGQYAVDTGVNYGANVDIWAPGVGIYSTVYNSDLVVEDSIEAREKESAGFEHPTDLTIQYTSRYKNGDGTSMAAPMVSASAALLWAIDPSLDVTKVKAYLLNNAGEAYGVQGRQGNPVPMLNVGKAVQALANDRDIHPGTGTEEEDEQEQEKPPADEKETGGTGTISASNSPDTSSGVYQMGRAAEGNQTLFYCNSQTETLYRMRAGDSQPQPFLTKNEQGGVPMAVMATEQYLYVLRSYPATSHVELYTFDGEKVGEVKHIWGNVYFENGYLYQYSDNTYIYRAEAVDGAESEVLVEECPAYLFAVSDGYLYYGTETKDLVRCRVDGSERTVLADASHFSWSIDGDKVYHGRLIYHTDYEMPTVLHSLELATMQTTDLVQANEGDTINGNYLSSFDAYTTGYLIGNVFVYQRNTINESYAIYGCNLDTGEEWPIVSVEQTNHKLTPVQIPGGSRLYYQLSEYNQETMSWEDSLCCIKLDGSGQRTLPLQVSSWY